MFLGIQPPSASEQRVHVWKIGTRQHFSVWYFALQREAKYAMDIPQVEGVYSPLMFG